MVAARRAAWGQRGHEFDGVHGVPPAGRVPLEELPAKMRFVGPLPCINAPLLPPVAATRLDWQPVQTRGPTKGNWGWRRQVELPVPWRLDWG